MACLKQAESHTRPVKGKQEAQIVAIHLPTKPHTLHPVSNGGVFIAYPDEGCDPLKKSLNSGS